VGNPVIFQGSKLKALKKEIQLGTGASRISGTVDPTVTAVNAEAGSLYQNETSGKVYRKTDSGSSTNWVELSGSNQILAKYYHSTGSTLNSGDIINFNSLVVDGLSTVTTGASWKFTAPETRSYKVEVYIESQSTSVSAGTRWDLQLFKNGTFHEQKGRSDIEVTATQFRSLTGSFQIDLAATDYIDVRFDSNGATFPMLGATGYSSIVIYSL